MPTLAKTTLDTREGGYPGGGNTLYRRKGGDIGEGSLSGGTRRGTVFGM